MIDTGRHDGVRCLAWIVYNAYLDKKTLFLCVVEDCTQVTARMEKPAEPPPPQSPDHRDGVWGSAAGGQVLM
ncbi:hypothetical protein [Pseudonocardia yunnanensis]|uniref:Uncharacterized protein n=1 Tax=Pseudonocardia yunnanensis TaxID=58107 RepID=A0ABW4EUD4_9PSEU